MAMAKNTIQEGVKVFLDDAPARILMASFIRLGYEVQLTRDEKYSYVLYRKN